MIKQPDTISSLRAINQQLNKPQFQTAKEVTAWMGAMQAQDYSMSKWALGIRQENSTEDSINKEINSGGIIRTHLLRPTWHLVSSDDIFWILELTAPRVKASVSFRDKQLELTDTIIKRCNRILEKSLRDNNHQTREELVLELKKSKLMLKKTGHLIYLCGPKLIMLFAAGNKKTGNQPMQFSMNGLRYTINLVKTKH